ncbi:MAG: formylglycine-generating enzyme family protein [Microcystis aeruginosa LL11-07]|nr:formylglycine-generating enzyme family protein [Microcystis aeruginosa LL11-07]
MGCPEGENGDEDERPQHPVSVESFLMGQTPITQEQWAVVAGWEKVVEYLNPDPSQFKGDPRRPVEQISWRDAIEFCARLRRKTQKDYRLPTEAQWEYACRAGTTTPFYFGETLSTELANYDGNYTYGPGSKGEYREGTTPVKSFPANAWGIYDMHGNVYEWCLDPWHDSYQDKTQTDSEVWDEEQSAEQYLLDENNVIQLLSNQRRRVLRGGSWYYDPRCCRCAFRGRYYPVLRLNYIDGFRVVCRFPRT